MDFSSETHWLSRPDEVIDCHSAKSAYGLLSFPVFVKQHQILEKDTCVDTPLSINTMHQIPMKFIRLYQNS